MDSVAFVVSMQIGAVMLDLPASPDFSVVILFENYFFDGSQTSYWFLVCPAFSCCKDESSKLFKYQSWTESHSKYSWEHYHVS